jgi:microcystin-dependent protein
VHGWLLHLQLAKVNFKPEQWFTCNGLILALRIGSLPT